MKVALRTSANWHATANCRCLADAHALRRFGADVQSRD